MEILEHEEAVLAACLLEPGAVRRVAAELAADRFTEGPTRDIYEAILDVHAKGVQVNSLSVGAKAPDHKSYVDTLLTFFARKQILDLKDLNRWVQFVDNVGRLRQAGLVISDYASRFKDFKNLVGKVSDPDVFLSDLFSELRMAQGNSRSGYEHIGVVAEEFERHLDLEFQGKITDRIPTGWRTFDATLAGGVPRGSLIVLAGLQATGKTQLGLQILEQIASRVRGCVAINSLEMNGWELVQRLACSGARVDSRELISGQIKAGSDAAKRLNREKDRLSKLPIYIDDSDFVGSTVIDYQSSALHAEKGPLEALMVDFAELVKDEGETNTEELRVSGIFRRAKSIAKNLGASVILLSQYSRGVTFKPSKLGENSSLRYSGMAESIADVILHVYNPFQLELAHTEVKPPPEMPIVEDTAYIVVGKDRRAGTGLIQMGWEPRWTRWSDRSNRVGVGVQDDF